MIRSGEVSSEEVVEAHIERIEAVNPRLNAVVADRFEVARGEAKEADARLASEQPDSLPPLLGVPCTVKESTAVAGMPHGAGWPPCQAGRPELPPHRDPFLGESTSRQVEKLFLREDTDAVERRRN
jgi:Asp-tRNA(Asn)/Glu-tRNA(Gln) amidotransferase A subunit family amidase